MDPTFLWDDTPLDAFQLHTIYEQTTVLFVIVDGDISNIYENLQRWLQPFHRYPWSNSFPRIRLCRESIKNKDGEYNVQEYIFGELIIGDASQDEMLLLYILMEFTKINESFIHFMNTVEIETLLVMSVDKLEEILQDDSVSRNRPWIHKGNVIVVNDHDQKKSLTLNRAIAQLENNDFNQREDISQEVFGAIAKYKGTFNFGEIFDIELKLPKEISEKVLNNSWILSKAVNNVLGIDLQLDDISLEPVKSYPIQISAFALIHLLYQQDRSTHKLDFVDFSTGLFLRGLNLDLLDSAAHAVSGNITDNSRITMQNELISQGRLSKIVDEDYVLFNSIMNNNKDNDEEVSKDLMSQINMFMENEADVENILVEEDEEEFEETAPPEIIAANDELKGILESDFPDFADFILQHREHLPHKEQLKRDYNDDSDYESDGELQGDMNYDEYLKLKTVRQTYEEDNSDIDEVIDVNNDDQIIDVDSEEDIAPYDYPEEGTYDGEIV